MRPSGTISTGTSGDHQGVLIGVLAFPGELLRVSAQLRSHSGSASHGPGLPASRQAGPGRPSTHRPPSPPPVPWCSAASDCQPRRGRRLMSRTDLHRRAVRYPEGRFSHIRHERLGRPRTIPSANGPGHPPPPRLRPRLQLAHPGTRCSLRVTSVDHPGPGPHVRAARVLLGAHFTVRSYTSRSPASAPPAYSSVLTHGPIFTSRSASAAPPYSSVSLQPRAGQRDWSLWRDPQPSELSRPASAPQPHLAPRPPRRLLIGRVLHASPAVGGRGRGGGGGCCAL